MSQSKSKPKSKAEQDEQSEDKVEVVEQASEDTSSEVLIPADISDLVITDNSVARTMTQYHSLAAFMKTSSMVKGKVPDIALKLMRGDAIGIDPLASVTQIYTINGTPTIGVHIMVGLLHQANGWIELDKQYEIVMGYKAPGNKIYPADYVDANKDKFYFIHANTKKEEWEGKGVIPVMPMEVDRLTQVTAYRPKVIDGKTEVKKVTFTYYLSWAEHAGLLEKDNWKNHPHMMCLARACAGACDLIIPDKTNGMRETSDYIDNVDESGLRYNVKADNGGIPVVEVIQPEDSADE